MCASTPTDRFWPGPRNPSCPRQAFTWQCSATVSLTANIVPPDALPYARRVPPVCSDEALPSRGECLMSRRQGHRAVLIVFRRNAVMTQALCPPTSLRETDQARRVSGALSA